VRELQVVTGRGNLVTCSRHERRDLFEAVLAGAGQVGIIVRATVALVPVEGRALIFNLFYDDLGAYLADQLRVMADGRFTYQEGQIVPRPDGSGWRYMIEAGVYYTPPTVPDQDALLAGLSDDRAAAVVVDQTYLEWVHRVDPLVVLLRGAGLWDLPHPWVSLFVPASRAAELAGQVTAQLTPDQLGAGLATFFPFRTAPLRRPLFVVPRPETRAFQLTLLRFPFPGADIPGLLAQNRALHDLAVRLGGKRYIIGAVPDATTADWRRHYGALWPAFRVAKELYDPDAVLTPGQGIFA
jgi:cytokinin dehydrogenase